MTNKWCYTNNSDKVLVKSGNVFYARNLDGTYSVLPLMSDSIIRGAVNRGKLRVV